MSLRIGIWVTTVFVALSACGGSPQTTADDSPQTTADNSTADEAFCTAVVETVGQGIDQSQLEDLAELDISPSSRAGAYANVLRAAVRTFADTDDEYFIDTMRLATLINEICGTELWGVSAHSDG